MKTTVRDWRLINPNTNEVIGYFNDYFFIREMQTVGSNYSIVTLKNGVYVYVKENKNDYNNIVHKLSEKNIKHNITFGYDKKHISEFKITCKA